MMTCFIGNKILTKFLCTKCVNKNFVKSLSSGLEQIVDVKGQIIRYLKVGYGDKNVLCFPGALGTMWTDFRPQIEGLDRQKITLIAWDPPGLGGSQPPRRCFGPKFYEHDAETAFDFMMKLGIKKFSLLGWSDGGISSIILAGKHPESIEKLIIWGAKSHLLAKDMEQYQKFRDLSKWSKKMKEPLIELYTEKGLAKMWGYWCDSITGIFRRGGDICKCYLANIQCPTLILYGDEDPMVSAEHPLHLYNSISNAKLYRFLKGKHNIHLKYSDEFNKVVMDFLLSKQCFGGVSMSF